MLGAQGNIWTEYIQSEDQLEYMALPRATALSEVVWSPKEHRDFSDFKKRFNSIRELYEIKDLNYAKHILELSEGKNETD